MTDLTKSVSRVCPKLIREAGKNRKIVITLEPPDVLYFRAKGCRKRYSLTADACYTMAVKAHVLAAKREKKKKVIKRGAKKATQHRATQDELAISS